ncbi:SIS domain-containing protein [Baekduia sp. Peel2402]|uniref:SIS domain-containing protein n=1 Tax=Baekduia sp. Peel2402 TaxID=3458296 RepID=UPI00403E73BF
MNPDGFLADVLDEPATLARVLDQADVGELRAAIARARLVVLTGMGSSRFAALTAAARLRTAGIAAVVEYASTDVPTKPAPDVLAIGISATGNSAETVAALARHHGTSKTIAITNAPDGGKLGALADATVPLHAGTETGGVACKTFQATLAVLLLAAGATPDALKPAADAQQALLDARTTWLDPLLDILEPASTVYTVAPASRISSAEQSALMLREGPRIPADATETGDWSHVDVYLSKYPNYTALLFPGSPYDAEALEWLTPRGAEYIAIGQPVAGAALHIPYNNADDPLVASLVDVTVAELAAATWWRRRLDANLMP